MSTTNTPISLRDALLLCGELPEVAEHFAHVTLPFTPMPHQIEGYQMARNEARSGLFFAPRTGKTLVMQMLAIFQAHYGVRTVQIMPPGLIRQFMHDYEDIKGHNLGIHALTEGPAKRAKLLKLWLESPDSRPDVVLMSKEIFKPTWHHLYQAGFGCVHFDESHLGLQNYDSHIAKEIRAFANAQNTRLILSTGTPIPNQVRNCYTTMDLINRGAYRSQTAFDAQHCIFKTILIPSNGTISARAVMNGNYGGSGIGRGFKQIKVVDSYVNLDMLSKNLYEHAVYASKLEVLDLESPNIQIVEVDLNKKHRALYNRLLRERMLEIETEVIDARTAQKLRMTALQLISVPEDYSADLGPEHNSLYQTLDDLLGTIGPEQERVVIFANFTRTVEALAKRYARYKPAIVYGPNGADRNAREVERFHTDPDCRLLLANPQSGGTGFKLGDCSQTVIFFEPVSSPGAFDQCISRVMLKGQTQPVTSYILSVRGTISPIAITHMLGKASDVDAIMKTKKSLFEALLGRADYDEDEDEEDEPELEAA